MPLYHIKNSIIKNLKFFENFSKEEIFDHRKMKFLKIGRESGFTKSSNLIDNGLNFKEPLPQNSDRKNRHPQNDVSRYELPSHRLRGRRYARRMAHPDIKTMMRKPAPVVCTIHPLLFVFQAKIISAPQGVFCKK